MHLTLAHGQVRGLADRVNQPQSLALALLDRCGVPSAYPLGSKGNEMGRPALRREYEPFGLGMDRWIGGRDSVARNETGELTTGKNPKTGAFRPSHSRGFIRNALRHKQRKRFPEAPTQPGGNGGNDASEAETPEEGTQPNRGGIPEGVNAEIPHRRSQRGNDARFRDGNRYPQGDLRCGFGLREHL